MNFLEELFALLKGLGFKAIMYMPTRNNMEQLIGAKNLCKKYDFFEISGENVNSPRQSFVCCIYKRREFKDLIDSKWVLISHEKASTYNIEDGMFSLKTLTKYTNLQERIKIYKEIGMADWRK
jgi:hypothetical protein